MKIRVKKPQKITYTKAMKCDPSGEKKGLSVPLCTNGIARKVFHIEASVFLANYCLYP